MELEEKLEELKKLLRSDDTETEIAAMREIEQLYLLAKRKQELVIQEREEESVYYCPGEKLRITIKKHQSFGMNPTGEASVVEVVFRKDLGDTYRLTCLDIRSLLIVLGAEDYETYKLYLDQGKNWKIPPPFKLYWGS